QVRRPHDGHQSAVRRKGDGTAGAGGQLPLDGETGAPSACFPKPIFLSAAGDQPAPVRREGHNSPAHIRELLYRIAIARVADACAASPNSQANPVLVRTGNKVLVLIGARRILDDTLRSPGFNE